MSLQQKLKSYITLRKRTISFFGRHQYHDWKICVAITACGMIVSALWGTYLYFKLDAGTIFDIAQEEKVPAVFDKKAFEELVIVFEEKNKNFEMLKVGGPAIKDPSI